MRVSKSSAPVEFLVDVARELNQAPAKAQLVPFGRHLRATFQGPRRTRVHALDADLVSCFRRILSMELRFTRLDASLLAIRFDQLTYLSYRELPLNCVPGTIFLFELFHCMPNLKSLLLIEISDGGYGKLHNCSSASLSAPNLFPPFRLRYYHYYGSSRFPFWHIPVKNSALTLRDLTVRLGPWGGSFDYGKMERISAVCGHVQRLVLEGCDPTSMRRQNDALRPSAMRIVVTRCPRLQFLSLLPTNWRLRELEHIAGIVLDSSAAALRILELGCQLSPVLVERLARDYPPGAPDVPYGLRALRLLILDRPSPGAELDAVLSKFASRRVRVVYFHEDVPS